VHEQAGMADGERGVDLGAEEGEGGRWRRERFVGTPSYFWLAASVALAAAVTTVTHTLL
jgi:hypothetical protein